jgi:uncharacterized protein
MINFEWDDRKDRANQRKHAVSFGEARTVFFDEFAIEFFDDPSSEEEERFLMLGMSLRARLLLVCHCIRNDETTIRIISARKATRSESKLYRGK